MLMMLRAWGRQDPADAHDARFWWVLVAYALRFGERPDPADAHDARFWWAQFAYFRKCSLVDSTQNPEPT